METEKVETKTTPIPPHVTAIDVVRGSWKPSPSSFEDQQRLVQMYIKSGVLPRRFDNAAQVLTALHFASEHFPGKEMTALRSIAVIDGTPTMFGDLPLAMAQRCPEFLMMEEVFNNLSETGEVKDDTQAVCTVVRRKQNGDLKVVRTFSVQDAKTAGLWGKKSHTGRPSPWVLYPKRMLQMRARSWALKDCFADVLFGIGIMEYDHNQTADTFAEKDVTTSKVSALNNLINPDSIESPSMVAEGEGAER